MTYVDYILIGFAVICLVLSYLVAAAFVNLRNIMRAFKTVGAGFVMIDQRLRKLEGRDAVDVAQAEIDARIATGGRTDA